MVAGARPEDVLGRAIPTLVLIGDAGRQQKALSAAPGAVSQPISRNLDGSDWL